MDRRKFLAGLSAAAMTPIVARADMVPTAGDVRDDIAILRKALALHPGLYRYNSPAQIDAGIGALEQALVAAPALDRRYLALSRFLATIRCGHSYANFFNQRKAVAGALFDRPTRLPFHFTWIDGAMIVIRDPAGVGIPAGTHVRTIDGVPAATMLATLMPYARADGHNDAKRRSLLGVTGSDRIEYFDAFHGLVYGAPAGGRHVLDLETPDGARQRRDVPTITLADRRAQMVPRDYSGASPVWDWAMRADGTAVLTMPSWALYDSKWDWASWLDDRLTSLAGAKGLLIDLRENEGGQDCGDAILARLIDRDLSPPGYTQKLRFQRTPADIDRYLDTWDDSFRTLGVGGASLADGFLARPQADERLTIKPKGPRLALPVATLIGPVNSSATFQFATMARASGRVRLFGETTGGNRRGINGGCFFFVRLPASGLEFDLPLVGYFAMSPVPDAGVDPDVVVRATASDIAVGRDPAMARALGWLAQR